jgi:hypothetical protein
VQYLQTFAPSSQPVNPDYPDQQIRHICQTLDIPFITLKDHLTLQDHKQYDVHWNAKGHRRVAKVLQRIYDEYPLVEPDGELLPTKASNKVSAQKSGDISGGR